ncbi:hypothetical protein BUALT_Bualt03G0212000 [Buddleja alternifolia]|uniref:Cytochrome P450 n=1 Tax=Buddleja alternifolia TaxID=168488 RepID=A0AAV6XXR3_9LAMI|nr:hypothetical protein BUALT_Bualt03G0212000 [Buddleja alternifolia]
MAFTMTASSVTPLTPPPPQSPATPQKVAVPGSYGWPVIGPLSDRLQYFWFKGPKNFFKGKIEKYESTVFRTNVPPTFPFFVGVNPKVIAVLDVKSFSHLFDMEVVEKANVLVGDFMPSVNFTGGLRVCAYLDTSEPKHAQVKDFALDILKRSSSTWVSSMVTSLDTMWDSMDSQLSGGSSASYFLPLQKFLFTFLSRAILNADPSSTPDIEKSGHIMFDKWLALQLIPITSINILQPLEEIFLHSFSYPFWLVKSDYKKLANFVKTEAKDTLLRAQTEFKLTEEEAIHNLLFILGFNAFGGFTVFLPTLITNLGEQKSIHEKLRKEVREILSQNSKGLTFETVKQMELINSFVYETLRLNPPVPTQYGRARKDFELNSHDAIFEIKKGELLCGYQALVMRDSKIFENPEDFVYDRFTKEKVSYKPLYISYKPLYSIFNSSDKSSANLRIVPLAGSVLRMELDRKINKIQFAALNCRLCIKRPPKYVSFVPLNNLKGH